MQASLATVCSTRYGRHMRYTLLIGCLVLAGCAAASDGWPSLARRPIEGVAATATATTAATVTTTTTTTVAASVPVSAATDLAGVDIDSRLTTIERDLDGLDARLAAQAKLVAGAATAAAGARPDSAAGSQAELETSRLGKLDGQVDEVRARLETIAGELAVGAAAGVDVGARLRRTGALIARTSTLAAPARAVAR